MKRANIIFASLIVFCLCSITQAMAQQSEIQRVRITSSRSYLYFSQKPLHFRSSLSADKKKITLLVKNTTAAESVRNNHGSGSIEDIYIQQRNNDIEISILLKEKLGYTATALSFSKAIVVDVFDWNTIKGVDDDYRSGLLALETSTATAQKYFLKAAAAGHADAAAHAGIILLEQGKTDEARNFLIKAADANTSVADAYAGLAQIYAESGDATQAGKMSKIFVQRTGVAGISGNPADSLKEPSSLASDAFIDSLRVSPDSALTQPLADDSLKTSTIEKSPEPIVFKNQNETKSSSWTMKILLSGLVILGGILGIVGWLYLRWRKQFKNPALQQPIARNPDGENPVDLLKTLQNSPKKAPGENFAGVFSHAAKAYDQADKFGDKPPEDSFKKPESDIKPFKNANGSNEQEKDTDFFLKDQEEMRQSWQELLNEKDEQKPQSQADETAQYTSPGNIELANNIRGKQQQQKSDALAALHSKDISANPSQLSEQAKNLGVEQSSLQTKKKLMELEADQARIEELRRKFSHD